MSSMTFIFKYIKKKHKLILGYIALIIECATPIIAVLIQRDLIDKVFIGKEYNLFGRLILLYAIFFLASKVFFTVRKVIFFEISYCCQIKLTKDFLLNLYELKSHIFNKEHSGKLLNNIRTDINEVCDVSINQIMSEMAKNIVTILFVSYSIARLNIYILIIAIVLLVLNSYLFEKFGKKIKGYSQKAKEQRGGISKMVEESVSSIREVIAFNRTKWQLENYQAKYSDYFKAMLDQGLYSVKVMFISEPLIYLTKIIAILFGGAGVILNKFTVGEFVIIFTFVDQLSTEIGVFFQKILIGKRLEASINCVKAVMENEKEVFGDISFEENVKSIKFSNVDFRYEGSSDLVLSNLTIDFPIGKKIAFVGASGSGKSTIAQLLLRAYTPENGSICINDVHIQNYDKTYTDKLSIVFQQPHFLPMSIKENLEFGNKYDDLQIENICKKMLSYDFINELEDGFETIVGERGAKLSGGQKQRIAIARAILKNTDILILDEATSALDNTTEYSIQQNIDMLRKGKTTIIIAHRISTIKNADVIYVLYKGSVVSSGTHDELMEKCEFYKELNKSN